MNPLIDASKNILPHKIANKRIHSI